MLRLLIAIVLLLPASAVVLDRIAITVGQQVITEQQLDEELRVTAFLNREKITRTIESRRRAADHLVQQLLVKREMEISHYPLPDEDDVEKYLSDIRETFDGPTLFDQALEQYDLSASVLKEHLALQLTTLRFIEFRFRPDAGISDADLDAAYRSQLQDWSVNHHGTPPPSLAASMESIRKALLEERTDKALDLWLEETRKQVSIVYLDKALR